MISKKAEKYIYKNAFHRNIDSNEISEDININNPFLLYPSNAIKAVEIAEEEMKQKAIDAFDLFVRDYCNDSNIHEISDDADHYLKVFEKLISNNPNELE